ncbi:protein commissureless 2 homolog [Topomyia yanbarensis]|uniref:protein commissureless 2 homolog n=1 Tax=Topomyia yanbarensis TaxID=2498891 RepID=UPI00273A90F9|nr:protein commissureless 2 homolog [Topomyia yanbarensis]
MLDNLESRITFEVPTDLDFDKLIRDNNYTLYWQNLHSEPYRQKANPSGDSMFGDRNSSDFNLMSSLKHFAGERSGAASGSIGWGISGGSGDGADAGVPLVDPSYLWIAAVMVLLILSGLFCVCSCYLYYKYRKWQKCVSVATCHTLSNLDVEAPPPYDIETLPSYTIASGLPTYEDAVRHLASRQQPRCGYEPARRPTTIHPAGLMKFFESRPQNWLNVTVFEEIQYNFVGRGNSAEQMESTPKGMTVNVDNNRHCAVKPANDNGLFRIQVCVLENEKDAVSNR